MRVGNVPVPLAVRTLLWGDMGPDSHRVDTAFDAALGKQQSLAHLALSWAYGRNSDRSVNYHPFPGRPGAAYSFLRDITSLTPPPLILLDWISCDLTAKTDPAFSAASILDGTHDAFIRQWARDARTFGSHLMIRFDPEMNGWWWPLFGVLADSNPTGITAEAFVRLWRYVVDVFDEEGATNVTWCWCINAVAPRGSGTPTAAERVALYWPEQPGDTRRYVHWTGFDSYNAQGGVTPTNWQTFADIVQPTYEVIASLAPDRPMLLGEFNTFEDPRKPAWFADMFATLRSERFPLLRAVSLFNWDPTPRDRWKLDQPSLAVWKTGVSDPRFLAAGDWRPPPGQPVPAPPTLAL
jgi:hypothetical protein